MVVSGIAENDMSMNKEWNEEKDLKEMNLDSSKVMKNQMKIQVKLVDFGFSKILKPKEKVNENLGTLVYVAPEIILREPYDERIDIWSLGVMLYYIIYEKFPFDDELDDEENIAMKIINGPLVFGNNNQNDKNYGTERQDKIVNRDLINLLKKCIKKDPEKRISASGILKHKWILDNKD